MATIDKNLGTVTAYKYAKNAGYEGTEEEFAQGLKNSAEYADNAQKSATAAAGSATAAATSATNAANANTAAQSAKTAAQTAQTAAEAWATGGSGGTPSATNNAEYWAGKAEDWAQEVNPENLAHIDGSYPDMTVGNAEQLVSTLFVEDTEPYTFRAAGGSHDIGNREYDEIVGGSLPWNQLVKKPSEGGSYAYQYAGRISYNGDTIINTALAATQIDVKTATVNNIDFLANHIYLFVADVKCSAAVDVKMYLKYSLKNTVSLVTNQWTRCAIVTSSTATERTFPDIVTSAAVAVGDTLAVKNMMLIDLTLMFGPTIADYIYSLEQSTAGAGVSWFRKLFPKDYYAYNAGTMAHVQTSAHEMVGFNAFDPAAGTARVLGGVPYQITGAYTALSLDGAAITPDADGIFTPDANGTLTVTGGDDATSCVHFVHSGYRNGEYEPYVEHVYPLDSSLTLRGIPTLDGDKLKFDGDRYSADGTVTRRYGERAYQTGDESLANTITDGTTTVYLLDTPTTETADPFQSPQIVDDFGTEEYVDAGIAAGTRDFAFPVGHDTKYPPNLRDKLQKLPSAAAENGRYVIQQTDGNMALVPDTSPGQIAALAVKVPDPPTADGTYRLTVTVTDGIPAYSWVSE